MAVVRADLGTRATIDAGSTIVADGATVEAGMRDVSGNSQNEYGTSATAGAARRRSAWPAAWA